MANCEECKNTGLFLADSEGHLEIQRCDTCQKFNSDKEAWESVKPKGY